MLALTKIVPSPLERHLERGHFGKRKDQKPFFGGVWRMIQVDMERSIQTIQDGVVKILFCDHGVRRFQTVIDQGRAVTFYTYARIRHVHTKDRKNV